jgi:hypothetical protein
MIQILDDVEWSDVEIGWEIIVHGSSMFRGASSICRKKHYFAAGGRAIS